jgi:hypothetical protein
VLRDDLHLDGVQDVEVARIVDAAEKLREFAGGPDRRLMRTADRQPAARRHRDEISAGRTPLPPALAPVPQARPAPAALPAMPESLR